MCCTALQCVAVHLEFVRTGKSFGQRDIEARCIMLQCVASCCSHLQCVTMCCNRTLNSGAVVQVSGEEESIFSLSCVQKSLSFLFLFPRHISFPHVIWCRTILCRAKKESNDEDSLHVVKGHKSFLWAL